MLSITNYPLVGDSMTENELGSAAKSILRVVPKVMRFLASQLRQEPYGLAPTHFRSMMMLAGQPRSLTDLADAQSVSLATMSRSVSVLVQRGWVERRKDNTDRRRLILEIAPDGEAVLQEVHTAAEGQLYLLLAALDEEQCSTLIQGLDVLNDVFSNAAGDEHKLGDEH